MTPEERREVQVDAANGIHQSTSTTEKMLDRLLCYFDDTEPAVADAIRFGVEDCGRWVERLEGEAVFTINYPEGHERR